MKKSLIIFFLFISTIILAQVPQGINYQSIIRTSAGAVMSNSAVTVEFKLYDGLSGPLLYHESHATTTNQFGMVNLVIGQGTQISGSVASFSVIPWAIGIGYEVFVNSNVIGTKQLFMSVPYALHSRAPIVTYSNNILSVGGNTTTINSSPTYSAGTGIDINSGIISGTANIVGTGATTVIGTYPNLIINTPTVAPSQSVSIVGINSATVTGSYPNFTVNVPNSGSTGVLPGGLNGQFLYYNSTVWDTLPRNNLYFDGTNFGVGTTSPQANFHVVGDGKFNASVTTPHVFTNTLTVTGGTFGQVLTSDAAGNGTFQNLPLPPTPTITGTGIAIVTPTTGTNFTVNVPKPTFSSLSGILSFGGTNTVSITSPLSLSGTTLTSGVGTNSVNLATLPSLWSSATTSVATSIFPTGIGNRVGIGTTTPNSLFEVKDYINFENVGSNTSLGHFAGVKASPLAYYNTFLGYYAGQAVTSTTGTAAANTYIGYNSGVNASFGNNNTFVGSSSGSSITTGSQNTFLGNTSGNGVTTGDNNVIIGQGAGVNHTTASNNVFIGNGSGFSTTTQYTNAVAIGYNARVNANNALVLGNTTTSVGIGVNAPVEKLEVNGNVQIDGATSEYKYGTAKTKQLSIPSVAFQSEKSNLHTSNSIGGQIYTVATTTLSLGYASYYSAPVYLPDGATVTNFEAYVVDEDATYNISLCQLWRSTSTVGTQYGTSSTMAQTSATSGSNTNIQLLSDNSITSPLIDNANYYYYVRFGGVYTGNQNIRLSRFVITYTINKAD